MMVVIGQSHSIRRSRVADYTSHGNTIVRIVPIEVGQNQTGERPQCQFLTRGCNWGKLAPSNA